MNGESASQRQADAARWLVAMDAADWDDTSEEALEAWLQGDPLRRGAFLRAQATWLALDRPDLDRTASENADSEPVHSSGGWVRRKFLVGAGAALAASFAGAIAFINQPVSYETSMGEIRSIPLADGSVASINTASMLKIQFAETRREARIERGEAWFQVAKDKTRPFIVEAGRIRVRAVGTAFSVRRQDRTGQQVSGAEILVTEGVVEAWTDGAEGNRVRLAAGSRAFVGDNAGVRVARSSPADVDRALAWRGGKIDLVGQPLNRAAAEFNRYNMRQIVIDDSQIASEQIDGVFSANDPEGFARALGGSIEIEVDTSDPQVIRIGRPGSRHNMRTQR
jgi:transmembrane sensor